MLLKAVRGALRFIEKDMASFNYAKLSMLAAPSSWDKGFDELS